MNEEQENRVTVRGRNENTATPQSGNHAHTEFFHLFKNCMGIVTAQQHVLLLNLGIISALSREAASPRHRVHIHFGKYQYFHQPQHQYHTYAGSRDLIICNKVYIQALQGLFVLMVKNNGQGICSIRGKQSGSQKMWQNVPFRKVCVIK